VKISIETLVHADLEATWQAYTDPRAIVQWNTASPDWHSPRSQVDLREGGRFSTRMEAKDGSMGFDFEGTYTRVVPGWLIEYRMDDGRGVATRFTREPAGVRIQVDFDAESQNPAEMQRQGWQAILDSFGRYVEGEAPVA
jgi:uncharacterized protein YndB with AHSA1/START domain